LAADPYTVLGVQNNASQDDIQKAYRQLAKKLNLAAFECSFTPHNILADNRF